MTGTQALRHHDNFLQVAKSYYQLTKPRIIPLLLITTAASMEIASKGQVSPPITLSYSPRWHSRRRRRSNLKLHL